ncbi:hypothetical protein XU18_4632 [Perkinsela sp. CCAP 1560/4]|nr:hypothetical protein XU18_4632 [Perkinsela sp. CCAP 1560/4]|eukprot:KNH04064.1 hypothetical protein XU18_4632 [Perkinsela sp. CCAP 1560/4]
MLLSNRKPRSYNLTIQKQNVNPQIIWEIRMRACSEGTSSGAACWLNAMDWVFSLVRKNVSKEHVVFHRLVDGRWKVEMFQSVLSQDALLYTEELNLPCGGEHLRGDHIHTHLPITKFA